MQKTVKINAKLGEGYRVDLQAGKHSMIIDQPESGGGKDEGPSPLPVFLFALGGCLATVAAIKARQERIQLRGFDVEIEGDIDTAFLMGKTTEGRPGFTEIRVNVNIDADMTDEEKQAFFEDVDARCPISDNMVKNTKIVFDVK
jgi:uncharacterized OsmC-like protein